MKTITLSIFICLLLSCKSRTSGGEVLPDFDVLLPDSITRINTSEIKTGAPIVLLYFSPDCEHCQNETEAILQHIDRLKDVRFYFITNDPFDRLKIFGQHYRLDKYSNILLGQDEQFFLLRYLKGSFPPCLVLYDKDKRKSKTFQGETPIDTIISSIHQLL